MSDERRRSKRYQRQKPVDDAACQRRGISRIVDDDWRTEFARLLVLSFACDTQVKAQQALIRGMIAAGDRASIQNELNELANLLLELRMLSCRLCAVFDR